MWIKHVLIENVRIIKHLDQSLKRGTVGVFGANGSGKSTFLALLQGVLTNDFGRFYGNRERMVSDYMELGEKSYAQLTCEHDGVTFQVTRSFPTGSSLRIGKAKPITSAAEIADELRQLGVDPDVLRFAGFRHQNEIDTFMSATDAERSKAYLVITNSLLCEQAFRALGDVHKTYAASLAPQTESTDTLQIQVTRLEADLERLETESEDLKQKLLTKSRYEEYGEVLRKAVAAEQAAKELAEAEAKHNKALAAARKLDKQLRKLEDKLSQAEQLENPGELYQRRDAWKAWQQFAASTKQILAERDAWRKARSAVLAAMQATPALEEGLQDGSLAAHQDFCRMVTQSQTKIDALTAQIDKVEKQVKKARDGQKCPTCDQPLSVELAQEKCQHWRMDRASLIADRDDAKKKADAVMRFLEAKKQHQAAVDHRNSLYAALKTSYARWQASRVKKPGTKDDYRKLMLQLKKTTKSAAKRRALIEARDKVKTALAEESQAVAFAFAKLEQVRNAAQPVDAEERDRAEKRRARHDKASRRMNEIAGERRQAEQTIKANKETIARLQQVEVKQQRLATVVETLQAARDVMHRDRLPHQLAIRAQRLLVDDINDRLGQYGGKFWVEPDRESLQFLVNFPDRKAKYAAELSIGQKVTLSLAFWDALADRFSLGLLGLDEPTANLDAENVGYLRDALSAMTNSLKGRRQVFVVTHADQLRSGFQQVVTL